MAWNNQVAPVSDIGISNDSGSFYGAQSAANSSVNGAGVPPDTQYPSIPPDRPIPAPPQTALTYRPPQQVQQSPMPQYPQQMQQPARQIPQNQSFQSAPQAARMPATGAYDGQAILGAQPGTDSDQSDASDDIWIERTKRAIAETQGDPHRQVQLLQHLSVLYLKERFNREVQADKG